MRNSPAAPPAGERAGRRLTLSFLRPIGRGIGDFFAMALDTGAAVAKRPFAWQEMVLQCWSLTRVALIPTLLVALPFTVLVIFSLNILLVEIGAADLSGAFAALGSTTQIGPIITVLVVAGAGSTAICADLGARTIREEIDALKVLGIDPIQRLVLPRVLASMIVAFLLNAMVCMIGIAGGFAFSVGLQNVSPGAFVAGLPLATGSPELFISELKATLFGMAAALIACYRGLHVKGGAKGVGDAVNETVVYAFMALFVINTILTAVGVKIGTGP